jgi:hypothetical protein
MIENLLKMLLTDVSKSSILTASKEMKIPYATLNRIVNGKSSGSMRIWEMIEKHYAAPAALCPLVPQIMERGFDIAAACNDLSTADHLKEKEQ